jgi:hypothetical protein
MPETQRFQDRRPLLMLRSRSELQVEQPEQFRQLPLLCQCGRSIELKRRGCCRSCYDRRHHSVRFFGGLREQVLERDRSRCTACGTRSPLLVHHRDRNNQTKSLITLCIRCHVRIHRSVGLRHWLSGRLRTLWRELHPHDPEQLQLAFKNSSQHHRQSSQQKALVIRTMPFFGSVAEYHTH